MNYIKSASIGFLAIILGWIVGYNYSYDKALSIILFFSSVVFIIAITYLSTEKA